VMRWTLQLGACTHALRPSSFCCITLSLSPWLHTLSSCCIHSVLMPQAGVDFCIASATCQANDGSRIMPTAFPFTAGSSSVRPLLGGVNNYTLPGYETKYVHRGTCGVQGASLGYYSTLGHFHTYDTAETCAGAAVLDASCGGAIMFDTDAAATDRCRCCAPGGAGSTDVPSSSWTTLNIMRCTARRGQTPEGVALLAALSREIKTMCGAYRSDARFVHPRQANVRHREPVRPVRCARVLPHGRVTVRVDRQAVHDGHLDPDLHGATLRVLADRRVHHQQRSGLQRDSARR
jgi:hypothetical protein